MFLSNGFQILIFALTFKILECIKCRKTIEETELIQRCSTRYPKDIHDLFEDELVVAGEMYTIFTDKQDNIMFLTHKESFLMNCQILKMSKDIFPLSCKEQDNSSWKSYKLDDGIQCFYGMFLHFAEALSSFCNYTTRKISKTYIIQYYGVDVR